MSSAQMLGIDNLIVGPSGRGLAMIGAGSEVVLCDIDGVLADATWREHLVNGSTKQWEEFFRLAVEDPPLAGGIELARALQRDFHLVFLTGRPMRIADETSNWLVKYFDIWAALIMREDSDRRPAEMFKSDMATRLISEGVVIRLVLDDDPKVITEMSRIGLATLAWPVPPTGPNL